MIAFDTNYVVRHLVQDDPEQCAEVSKTLREESGSGRRIVLHDIVLCETLWVLEAAYRASRKDLLTTLTALTSEPAFVFENPERIERATRRFAAGKADFADCLLLEICAEKGHALRTFDRKPKNEIQTRI